ncbi:protein S100-A9-like [Peromyscus eremicus]|uniref:protein S100-A9-like n=1 Tax=Peromyscus eremicus TaxID=42410 RepID=UPI0027DC0638|nr:protein S100-A9-like [Peromyscus eremicus]
MSQMEQGMETIIKTFHKHSGKEGDPDTLSQKEFNQLVNKDMPNTLKKEKKDQKAMNQMMKDLDTDKDGQLCFDEFVGLLIKVLITDHKKTHKHVSSHDHDRSHDPSYGPSLREDDHHNCHSK